MTGLSRQKQEVHKPVNPPNGSESAKGYMTIKQAAELWHVEPRTIRRYCKTYHKQIGAYKNKQWYIPNGAFPPYKIDDFRSFIRAYLRYRDNPSSNFPMDRDKEDFELRCLIELGYVELRKPADKPSIDNIFITDEGWRFLYNDARHHAHRYAAIELKITPHFSIF